MQPVNSTLTKQINQQLILQIIQSKGPISRKKIADISGLSPAAISGITGALVKSDLVYELGEADSLGKAGRKAILLKINPNAGYVLGVIVAVSKIWCVITNLDAKVLHFSHRDLMCDLGTEKSPVFSPERVIQETIISIEDLLSQAKIQHENLRGIGVGLNGIVDVARGVSVLAPHFDWHNVSITEPISKHFGIPVFLENDGRVLTIAEQLFGVGRGVEHFVTVMAGYGIGAGIVTNGRIYRGGMGGAGEFGHTVLQGFQHDGPVCHCGKRGCVESFASVPAVVRQIGEALDKGEASLLAQPAREAVLTLETIADAADAGDALARHVLAQAGATCGAGIAWLVNILNPQRIIVYGEAVRFGEWYLQPMQDAMRRLSFDGLAVQINIAQAIDSEMWARGAACIVLSSLFDSKY